MRSAFVPEVSLTVPATPEAVFAVLADGWTYPLWVVGATHMRDVDATWPAVGSRLHHKVGPWPLQIADATTVLAVEPNRRLELEAAVWPVGAAYVRLALEPVGSDATQVTMYEKGTRGPGALVPDPVQAALVRPRNVEALRRLGDIAVNRRS